MDNLLEELEAIKQLKARYFRYLDTKQWDKWREVFSDDFTGKFDGEAEQSFEFGAVYFRIGVFVKGGAIKEWGAHLAVTGSKAGTWVWYPGWGMGDIEHDYKVVVSHPDFHSVGADFEPFTNGQGYVKGADQDVRLWADGNYCGAGCGGHLCGSRVQAFFIAGGNKNFTALSRQGQGGALAYPGRAPIAWPPDRSMIWPLMKPDVLPSASHNAVSAISSTVPIRPTGILATKASTTPSIANRPAVISVSIRPAAMELKRIFLPVYSAAAIFTTWSMPARAPA